MDRFAAIAILRKAGLSGLFAALGVAVAAANPLTLEIADATSSYERRMNESVVTIRFTRDSREALGRFTQANVGRKIELRVGGRVIISAVVREPILGGALQTAGGFSPAQGREMAASLVPGTKAELDVVKD